jgi:phosphatidylinositol alpha-1,6-mannosyltransferase
MAAEPRLLLLTPDFPPARGGIQLLSHRLATGIAGFDVEVVTLDAPGAAAFDASGSLRVRRVRTEERAGATRNVPLNAAALARAQRHRPEVVLSMHMVVSPAAAAVRRLLGARTVQYFYAKEIGARPSLARFAVKHADTVIAISAYSAALVRAVGASPEHLTLIPPGVDLPEQTAPLPCERPTFLTIARLEDRYKGHDVLLRALPLIRAKVPDARWVVIGDGPLRSGLEDLADSLGVADAVQFLGAVSDEERNIWLRRAHALAMPSRLPAGGFAGEGFGIVYLEAGAYGKPVLAANVAGALDAVRDGETGLLVDPTDQLAVAEAMTRLLLDAELARRLGRAGAEWAQSFAWPRICERVAAVLRGEEGGPSPCPTGQALSRASVVR